MARVTYIYGKKLARFRDRLAITQRQLGDAVGVSDETISRIERHEIAGLLSKWLPGLATALHMELPMLMSELAAPVIPPAYQPPAPQSPLNAGERPVPIAGELPNGLNLKRAQLARVVPEYRTGVAASRRVEKVADRPDANRLAITHDRRPFSAPVDGDCQDPKWKHGELVIFSFDAYEREGILAGKSYYLAFADGSTTFKRVFLDERDPDVLILRCWNRQKYPRDQRVHRDEIVRVARAISKQVLVDEGD